VSKQLYVGNLALGIGNKDLEKLFAEAGVCESAAVITDRATGRSRGFGYVEMASNRAAQKAIQQLDGQEFTGRRVCIYAVNSAGM
jgi:RNA recognition motif-containing protein